MPSDSGDSPTSDVEVFEDTQNDKDTGDTLQLEKKAPKSDLSETKPRGEANSKDSNDAHSDAADAKVKDDLAVAGTKIEKLEIQLNELREATARKQEKLEGRMADLEKARGDLEQDLEQVKSEKRISSLESTVNILEDKNRRLEEAKGRLEDDVKTMNRSLLELNRLNGKVSQLELFEKKCWLVSLALSAAAVSSSTLAVVGALAFHRRRKLR